MLISVDSGKENTKYMSNSKLGIFKTRIAENEEVIKGVDINSHNIVINGIMYKVGGNIEDSSFEISKDSNIHRISILTAISILKPSSYERVQVVTGTPINLFFTEDRNNIKDKLIGNHSVIFKGEAMNINIDKVLVVPESMGVIYNNYSLYKDKLVNVIDIGGLNSNGCIYRNGVPVRESIFTLNSGIKILINKIKNHLNSGGYNYQSYEVEHILKNGSNLAYERDVIEGVIVNHLYELKQRMRANNWNVDRGEILFTGGGSDLLNNYIKSSFKNSIISEDSLYDNVKGFYRMGVSLI